MILYLICYAAVAVFLVAVVSRLVKLARLPMHVRWELYPVAHDARRARYGGSYMEEFEWWTKPRETSRLAELKVMGPEILFLQGVRHHNKSQWWRSFPFHFGLYLLIATGLLLLIGGILGDLDPGGFFGTSIPILGYAGLGLALLGAFLLLLRRITDAEYREYTNPVDYMNLGLFVVAMGVSLLAHLGADLDFGKTRELYAGLLRWEAVSLAPITVVSVVLFAILVAYVPLTHMSHFVTKYFMYHDIRWGDKPLDAKTEAKVGKILGYHPTWAAPHIAAQDGSKTWADVATTSGLPDDDEGGAS